ncbi:MAG: hypothetical protein U5K99_02375 [Anaerolineales bacterium]|nr:hypothetical protein [Anaerolineales bacterium]
MKTGHTGSGARNPLLLPCLEMTIGWLLLEEPGSPKNADRTGQIRE